MKNVTMFRGKVKSIRQINKDGHPRWQVVVKEGKQGIVCVTPPRSPLAYKVPLYINKRVTVRTGIYYGKNTLTSIRKERS